MPGRDHLQDRPREHRLHHGARSHTELPGGEAPGGGGEEDAEGAGGRGAEQPHEGAGWTSNPGTSGDHSPPPSLGALSWEMGAAGGPGRRPLSRRSGRRQAWALLPWRALPPLSPSSCTEGRRPRTLSLGPARQVLENRTKDSKLEMEVLENLQELKDLNQRQAHVDFEAMLQQHRLSEEQREEQEREEDEREAAALVEEARRRRLLEDSDSEEDAPAPAAPRLALRPKPTAILDEAPKAKRKAESWERSVGTLGSRPQLSGLVVVKRTDLGCSAQEGLAPSPTTQGPVQSGKPADPAPWAPGASSLSQLGAYSDSEDSSGSN
ncbi:splicing factor YJU2 isoform X2 [Mirounga angustirostris]|uniref:splicing factor YJU2 isoform X2 n=1 Tax=Mirounga angustirostris TaxID=9716 RepID=UPI00313EBE6F